MKKTNWIKADISYAPLVLGSLLSLFVVYLLQLRTQEILYERLRERLISIAGTAALQFSGEEISKSKIGIPEKNETYIQLTNKLRKIRAVNTNLEYIYILEPTKLTTEFVFIADADSLATLEEIDYNKNGLLDENEVPPKLGEAYDAGGIPIINDALQHPTADLELNTDQWGTFLSGYAPILDSKKQSVALLGIDVEVSDFKKIVQATLVPFVLLSFFLLTLLAVVTIFLVRTWRNRVEIVKEIDNQKDELLGMVSHQLATPITSFKWYLELILDDCKNLTTEQLQNMKSMQTITQDLAELVNMILDVSRIQLGKMKIDKTPVNIDEFINGILDVAEPRAAEKKIILEKQVQNLIGTGNFDTRLTRMTIENLVTNAVKYTKNNGKVVVKVYKKNHILFIEIQDSGVGIPVSDQPKIFGKLYRATNVRGKIDGNGFGLFIAKGAIESQGGKIYFQSKENEGTTFFVELPI